MGCSVLRIRIRVFFYYPDPDPVKNRNAGDLFNLFPHSYTFTSENKLQITAYNWRPIQRDFMFRPMYHHLAKMLSLADLSVKCKLDVLNRFLLVQCWIQVKKDKLLQIM